ncbi:MAG: UPF0179 family protein [Candidatus Hodarchaeota archaeon]
MHSYKGVSEAKKDYVVTLAAESSAKVGEEFYHEKVPEECKECELFQICMKNLSNNRFYQIIEVKEDIAHKCPKGLHEEDLRVIKVRECPLEITFPVRKAFEGILLKYHPQPCIEKECKYYEICNPPQSTIAQGTPVKVIRILKKLKIECKFKRDLGLLIVKREN